MEKQITVWTNGRAIRSYTGQDKITYKKGWYKATAIIKPIEEEKKDGAN